MSWSWDESTGTPTPTYELQFKLRSAVSWSITHAVSGRIGVTRSLTNDVIYDFRVRSINTDSGGTTHRSTWATGSVTPTAGDTVPAKPQVLTLSQGQSNRVRTTQTATPADGGQPILDYSLQRKKSTDASWTTVTSTWSGVGYNHLNLDSDEIYQFRYAARSSIGLGPYSDLVEYQTAATPSVPTKSATPTGTSGNGQVTLSWVAHTDSAINLWEYQRRTPGQNWPTVWTSISGSSASTTSFTDRGLTNGQQYEYRIRPSNSIGAAPASDPVIVIPFTTPNVSTLLIASFTDVAITVSWVVGSNKGSTIIEHDLEYREVGTTTWIDVVVRLSDSRATIGGLDDDTEYEFRFKTRNGAGWARYWGTAKQRTKLTAGPPGQMDPPTLLNAAVSSITIVYTPPDDTGGAEIHHYIYGYRLSGQSPAASYSTVAVFDTQVKVTNLQPGTAYDFIVKANNLFGNATYSNSATFSTLSAVTEDPLIVHSLLYMEELDARFWTGFGTLDFEGQSWLGVGDVADLVPAPDAVYPPITRATLKISVTDPDLRAAVMQDTGPYKLQVRMMWSKDGGGSWNLLPRQWTGRLSNPIIRNGIFECEIETWQGDVDLGYPSYWSDEDHKRRYPGDRFLEGLSIRAREGLADITWPP